ncbi:MAG: FAD-binding protein [Polyangiales bacterium]
MIEFVEDIEQTSPGSVRRDGGQLSLIPPSTHALGEILAIAHRTRTALDVPGSDSRPTRPALRLDRLDGIIAVDDVSRILHVQAGIPLGEVEARASDHGWTLGIPSTHDEEPIGAWLARGAPGRPSKADDPVPQLVAGLELVLPRGEELTIRPAPRRAVGPDLIRVVIGARGRLGVISGVHMVARRRVLEADFCFSFVDEKAASEALFAIRGAGVRPFRATTTGNTLQVVIESEGPRHRAAIEVMKRIVEQRHGRPTDPSRSAPSREPIPESGALLDRLAPELDPHAILQ